MAEAGGWWRWDLDVGLGGRDPWGKGSDLVGNSGIGCIVLELTPHLAKAIPGVTHPAPEGIACSGHLRGANFEGSKWLVWTVKVDTPLCIWTVWGKLAGPTCHVWGGKKVGKGANFPSGRG